MEQTKTPAIPREAVKLYDLYISMASSLVVSSWTA